MMEIIDRDAFWITGIKIQASWDELWQKMPKAWNMMFEREHEIRHRTDDILMDISFDKNGDIYTQFIAAQVSDPSVPAPEGMETIQIPGKKYLYFKHSGALKEIAASFGKMYDHAKRNDLKAGEFKIDEGYKANQDKQQHHLYIEILS